MRGQESTGIRTDDLRQHMFKEVFPASNCIMAQRFDLLQSGRLVMGGILRSRVRIPHSLQASGGAISAADSAWDFYQI